MKQYIPCRIAALQDKLRERGLDAALIYDRENLIYFAGISDLEGGVLCVPSDGTAELFCLWMEAEHMRRESGLKVTGYLFPADTQSTMAAKWLHKLGLERPRVGFTRYFISLKDYQCLREAVPQMKVEDIAAVCYQLRSIKCPEEIWRIRAASKALKAGMDAALSVVRAGISERDVLVEAEYAMGKAGSQGSPFRMQVLTHSRQMQKHPYAGAALLEDNAPVVIGSVGGGLHRKNVPYGLSGYAAGGMCGDLPGAPEGSGNRSRQTAPRRDLRSALSGCCRLCGESRIRGTLGDGTHWLRCGYPAVRVLSHHRKGKRGPH